MQNFVPRTRIGIFGNERTRSTPLVPNLKYWFVSYCLGAFLDLFRYCTKLGAKRVQLVQLMKKFVPRNRIIDFRNERTRPPYWTLNSWISAFCSVWVHFGLFRYCMKLGAKWAELVQLMQKFVPRTRIGTFTTNAPDPPHCTLNSCFGALWICFVTAWNSVQNGLNWCN